MRAAIHDRYGPPEVLRIEEVADPAPGPGELLVRVHRSSVNRTDSGFRKADPFIVRFFAGIRRPRARVLGNEFAGVVELSRPVSTNSNARDIEAVLARNFDLDRDSIKVLSWARLH